MYFSHGVHTLSEMKHLKAKFRWGTLRQNFTKWGVRGLICVTLGFPDMKMFGNPCRKAHILRYNIFAKSVTCFT